MRCVSRSRRRRPTTPRRSEPTPACSRARSTRLADDYRTGLASLRTHRSRHEPRRVRLPGRRIRPDARGDHGVGPRCRTERATPCRAEDPRRTGGITTIFTEDLVSPKVAETLADRGRRSDRRPPYPGRIDRRGARGRRRLRFADAREPRDLEVGAWLLLIVTCRALPRAPAARGIRGLVLLRADAGPRARRPPRRVRESSWRSSVQTAPASRRSLKLLLGSLRPRLGQVRSSVRPAARQDRWRLGYVPQRPVLGSEVPATVEEIVATGRLARRGWWRPLRKEDRDAARHAMESVGLAEFARRPSTSSPVGSSSERSSRARSRATRQLLVLDEPIAGVDAESQRRFRDSLVHLMQRPRCRRAPRLA